MSFQESRRSSFVGSLFDADSRSFSLVDVVTSNPVQELRENASDSTRVCRGVQIGPGHGANASRVHAAVEFAGKTRESRTENRRPHLK